MLLAAFLLVPALLQTVVTLSEILQVLFFFEIYGGMCLCRAQEVEALLKAVMCLCRAQEVEAYGGM